MPAALKSPLVMIVDDDEEDIYLAKRAFKAHREDIRIVSAPSGTSLLDYLNQTGNHENGGTELPNIILMDINMPMQNGFEIVSTLRAESAYSQIPVIMLTTSDSEYDINRAYEVGANSYLCKSINAGEMKSIIMRVCEFWLDLAKLPKVAW